MLRVVPSDCSIEPIIFLKAIVPALGGAERKLADAFTAPPGSAHQPSLNWSPDGNHLAVADKSAPEPYRIFLLAHTSGERRALTSPLASAIGDFSPAFSPDGGTLAFVRMNGATEADLYLAP